MSCCILPAFDVYLSSSTFTEQFHVSVTSCRIRGESCLLYIHFHLLKDREKERERKCERNIES